MHLSCEAEVAQLKGKYINVRSVYATCHSALSLACKSELMTMCLMCFELKICCIATQAYVSLTLCVSSAHAGTEKSHGWVMVPTGPGWCGPMCIMIFGELAGFTNLSS